MLTSPVTVTIDGTAHSLSKVNQDNFSSVFRKKGADYEIDLVIKHSYEGKPGIKQVERHVADLTYTKFSTEGVPTVYQSYQHIRTPRGDDGVFAGKVAIGLGNFAETNIASLMAWES
jgi:hypothetical protein